MHIHLHDRHCDVRPVMSTIFIRKPSSQNKVQVCPCLVQFLGDMVAASSTLSSCSYNLELHLANTLCSSSKVFFCQQVLRKMWVLSSPENHVGLSILSSSFRMLSTGLVYILCHPHLIKSIIISSKNSSLLSVWTQNLKKSHCILVSLNSKS